MDGRKTWALSGSGEAGECRVRMDQKELGPLRRHGRKCNAEDPSPVLKKSAPEKHGGWLRGGRQLMGN